MRDEIIYLDHAATTPPLPCAIEAFLTAPFENASSGHACGQAARNRLEEARATVARCIGAEPSEIVFVSGATEGAATVLHTLYQEGFYIEASPIEHHSTLENIPMPERDSILDTKAYVTMLVNNETGLIMALPKKETEYQMLYSDLTSAVGHILVDVKELGLDYATFGAHKFGGLAGIGAIYVRKGLPLHPLLKGGGQERGMRAGTESVALASAMAAALEWQRENLDRNFLHVVRLRAEMLAALRATEYAVNNDGYASPYILNVSFPGAENGALALMLSNEGVMVSTGAACTTGDNAPSHVLMEIYGDEARARSAIRISFSHATTEDEVKIAAKKIVDCVKILRGMTGWQK